MELPQDDFILLSFLNMKLRDNYRSLEELCEEESFPREAILSRLEKLGYSYNPLLNAFIPRP